MRRDGTTRLGHPGRQALSNASRLCCFKALATHTAAGRAALSRNGLDYTRETRVRKASLGRVISEARCSCLLILEPQAKSQAEFHPAYRLVCLAPTHPHPLPPANMSESCRRPGVHSVAGILLWPNSSPLAQAQPPSVLDAKPS